MHPLAAALPKLQPLRTFEAAGRLGSFTAAGNELGLTQPAVTQHIAQLETALSIELFVRSSNRVRLSEDGATLLHSVAESFDRIAETLATLARERTGTFVLAANPAIAQRWLVPHLTDLQEGLGDVRLWLFDRESELTEHHFDAAIHLSAAPPPRVNHADLFDETVVPVAAPDFARTHRIGPSSTPDELPQEHLLHLDHEDRSWMYWADWFAAVETEEAHAPARVLYNNHALLMQDVLAGRGIGLGWRGLVDDHIDHGTLVPVGREVTRPGSAYRVLWPNGTPRATVDALIAFFGEGLVSPGRPTVA